MVFGLGRARNGHRTGGFFDDNDIVIAVMGPTGVGKSSFVNKAAGSSKTVVSNSLKSQTRSVLPIRCQHPDGRRNIVLVDTPGFDDTYLSDSEILGIIADWLKKTYQNNIRLAGLLYLHRISDVRMAGTPLRNLSVFKDLCGAAYMKNIILVTTMWDEIGNDASAGYKREEELVSSFWREMISRGSRTCRFQGTPESAWEILDRLNLVPHPRLLPLQIQEEMVDRHLPLQETAAAKTLLGSLAAEFKKVWVRLLSGSRRATGPTKRMGRHPRQPVLSRSSTIKSTSSGSGLSAVSEFTDTSSIASCDSEYQSSLAGEGSFGCNTNGRRNTIPMIITSLRLPLQMADIASIAVLRGSIATVMRMAQHIEKTGGAHHAIIQVVESSAWLLEEIVQYAVEFKLSTGVEVSLNSYQSKLDDLQDVVMNASTRNRIAPFFLREADIQVITACITSIKKTYEHPEVSTDSRLAIPRLDHLHQLSGLLCNSSALQKCECGISVVHEE